MKLFTVLFLSLGLLAGAGASAHAAYKGCVAHIDGEGLPLPWPFPWAKECPIIWESLQGRYSLMNSNGDQEIELKVRIVTRFGNQEVEISRLGSKGQILARGSMIVTDSDRELNVTLNPVLNGQSAIQANLKFYYSGNEFQCAQDQLVPILTLSDPSGPTSLQYRLIRVQDNGEH